MLARNESTVTIADSCQSLSPCPTPKKRPYTQVFSTPVTHRVSKKGRLEATPPSPLRNVFITALTSNEYEEGHRLSERNEPVAVANAATQTVSHREDHDDFWEKICAHLEDKAWIAAKLGPPGMDSDCFASSASYGDLTRVTQQDYQRLCDVGDLDDPDMRESAIQYVLDRHIVRASRLLRHRQESRSEEQTTPASECVPPTPPGSHPRMEQIEGDISCGDIHTNETPSSGRPPTFTLTQTLSPQLYASQGDAEIPPWPASGGLKVKDDGRQESQRRSKARQVTYRRSLRSSTRAP